MNRRGQNTLEYAALIAIVIAAFVAMQHYINRGVQGKLRESTDSIGGQYSAGKVDSTFKTEQLAKSKTKDTFGLEKDGTTPAKGDSYYEVITPAGTKVSALGADAEIIKTKIDQEKLFE